MGKKKSNSIIVGLNAAALLFAVLVIVSFFFSFVTYKGIVSGTTTISGWKIFESDGEGDLKTYVVISVILSAVVAGIAVLRLLKFPFFGTKLFSFIFMGAAVALVIFAILMMVGFNDYTGGVSGLSEVKLGFGVILNLICSILAAGCTVGAFLVK